MNSLENFDVFLKNIMTARDLAVLLDDISEINQLLYIADSQKLSKRIINKVSKNTYETVLSLEEDNQLPEDPSKCEDYFAALKLYVENIPKVILTIAFEPSTDFVRQIYNWFEGLLAKKILLEIRTRPAIIAGLIIEYNGKYKDYTRAAKFDEALIKL